MLICVIIHILYIVTDRCVNILLIRLLAGIQMQEVRKDDNGRNFYECIYEKLDSIDINKENQPNKGPELTNEFVGKQVELYTNLIKSEIFNNANKG